MTTRPNLIRAEHCSDCGVALDADNAFHPYGDCAATRCKDCDAAAWARINALAATRPAQPANTVTNVWD
jgi:endogenous inhibitor of DNA gyrase (YacG/DUF329 family)